MKTVFFALLCIALLFGCTQADTSRETTGTGTSVGAGIGSSEETVDGGASTGAAISETTNGDTAPELEGDSVEDVTSDLENLLDDLGDLGEGLQ